ncbi:TMEM165/GDT1 family protein [Methylotetracoccus oryzae]|uniref:TMEM165/GDT1 family protein n=1 Tax=Methylotetracoccus oryzae TaxID=1919059 RepID=UPI00111A254A|nr:TMEM165/GDT1 family protein [Methylotetracoccus oryzae]
MACPLSTELHTWLHDQVFDAEVWRWFTVAGTSFLVIAAAEIGDKSQLVCMMLSARHRGLPVMLGALAAFGLLNLMAVVFGAAIAEWVPRPLLLFGVAALFAVFGLIALLSREDEAAEEFREMRGHGVFATTFLMLVLAEFGDKTQLATAGLSVGAAPLPVWTGATLGLGFTSALGIYAGRTVLQRIPLRLLHRISGVMFLMLAGYALANALAGVRVTAVLQQLFPQAF